jgi:transcription elongation factor Elf1
MVEKRKEYGTGEIIFCPVCESNDLDDKEAPETITCRSCGLEFHIRWVAVWDEEEELGAVSS